MNDFFDPSDLEEAHKRQAESAKRLRDRDLGDIRKVLSSMEGRRFIWRLMSSCGVFHGSFTGNSTTFFNEGRRDIGLLVLRDLMEAKPDAFAHMQREYAAELKQQKEKTE